MHHTNHVLEMHEHHFSRYGGKFMEVFMDNFSVFGSSFDDCLANLDLMFAMCEKTN